MHDTFVILSPSKLVILLPGTFGVLLVRFWSAFGILLPGSFVILSPNTFVILLPGTFWSTFGVLSPRWFLT